MRTEKMGEAAAEFDTTHSVERAQRVGPVHHIAHHPRRRPALRTHRVGPLTYIPTLTEMIEAHTERMASLRNRVPTSVMLLQIGGSAIAIGVLAAYLALLGRSEVTALLAGAFVVVILFVSFDLDRPQRGFITVPYTALVDARSEMDLPPAAGP